MSQWPEEKYRPLNCGTSILEIRKVYASFSIVIKIKGNLNVTGVNILVIGNITCLQSCLYFQLGGSEPLGVPQSHVVGRTSRMTWATSQSAFLRSCAIDIRPGCSRSAGPKVRLVLILLVIRGHCTHSPTLRTQPLSPTTFYFYSLVWSICKPFQERLWLDCPYLLWNPLSGHKILSGSSQHPGLGGDY